MAEPAGHDRDTIIGVAAGAVIALLLVLFTIASGHNNGRAPNGEGNPMQTDQGR